MTRSEEGESSQLGVDQREPGGIKECSELFKILLPFLAASSPDIIPLLLFAGNRALYQETIKTAYKAITVHVPIIGGGKEVHLNTESKRSKRSKADSVNRFPHHSEHVLALHFHHPDTSKTSQNHLGGITGSGSISPLSSSVAFSREAAWKQAERLISMCENLRELRWETGYGVNDAMWRSISSKRRLRGLFISAPPRHPAQEIMQPSPFPRITPKPQMAFRPVLDTGLLTPKYEHDRDRLLAGLPVDDVKDTVWGGWTMGLGWKDLEQLSLADLSLQGAKSLSAHCGSLCQDPYGLAPMITKLSITTHFLDASLLASIGQVGAFGILRHLELGTTGTKLSGEALKGVIEACRGLKSFRLRDIEGRLDKTVWRSITAWPVDLKDFQIEISESNCHHSWVLQHLSTISYVPIHQLHTFRIQRIVHPVALLPFPPSNTLIPSTQSGCALERVPIDMLRTVIKGGSHLQDLCLDWWELDATELEVLVKSLPNIRRLEVAVRASMLSIIAMGTVFSGLSALEHLSIASQPKWNTATALSADRSLTEEELYDLPTFLAERAARHDPNLPELRDLRKFVRRLPKLRTITWTGRGGKGEWRFSKKSTLVCVDFLHSASSTKDIWVECQEPAPLFIHHDDPRGDEIALLGRYTTPLTPESGGPPHQSPTANMASSPPQRSPRKSANSSTQTSPPGDRRKSLPALRKSNAKPVVGLGLGMEESGQIIGSPRRPSDSSRIKSQGSTTHRRASTSTASSVSLNSAATLAGNLGNILPVAKSKTSYKPDQTASAHLEAKVQYRDSSKKGYAGAAKMGSPSVEAGIPRIVPGAGILQKIPKDSSTSDALKAKGSLSASAISSRQSSGGWTTVGDAKKASKSARITSGPSSGEKKTPAKPK